MWIQANEKYQVNELGEIRNSLKNFTVKQTLMPNGYLVFGNNRKNIYAHRFIWEAFYGPIPKNMQINHKNEIKTDNRICNLELVTCKENINYGTANKRRAEKLSKSIIQIKDGVVIAEYTSLHKAARALSTGNPGNIGKCLSGLRNTAYGFQWKYKN